MSPLTPLSFTTWLATWANSSVEANPHIAKPLILSFPTYFTKLASVLLDLASSNGRYDMDTRVPSTTLPAATSALS